MTGLHKNFGAMILGMAIAGGSGAVVDHVMMTATGGNSAVQKSMDAMAAKLTLLEQRLNSYENSPVTVSHEAIRTALLADPTVLVDAAQKLQDNRRAEQASAAVDMTIAEKSKLLQPTHGLIGNPKGSHVIVEFYDYQCPHCRHAESYLHQLASADPELLILRREIAALGQGSEIAARTAIAAAKQGLYDKVSAALLQVPTPITLDSALAAAQAAGADMSRLKTDMTAKDVTDELMDNQNLSVRVGVVGTPALSAPGAGTMNGIGSPKDVSAFIDKAASYEQMAR